MGKESLKARNMKNRCFLAFYVFPSITIMIFLMLCIKATGGVMDKKIYVDFI